MSRARAALVAAGLLSALALGGCAGGDPKPIFAPPASTSPATPSTSAAAIGSPSDAFRNWVTARNAALQSGDVSPVTDLSEPSCKTCMDAIEPIERVHAAGGWFHTPGWTVVSTRIKSQDDEKVRLSAAIRYESGQTLPSAGADVVSYDSEGHIVMVDLSKVGGRWLVQDLVYVS